MALCMGCWGHCTCIIWGKPWSLLSYEQWATESNCSNSNPLSGAKVWIFLLWRMTLCKPESYCFIILAGSQSCQLLPLHSLHSTHRVYNCLRKWMERASYDLLIYKTNEIQYLFTVRRGGEREYCRWLDLMPVVVQASSREQCYLTHGANADVV